MDAQWNSINLWVLGFRWFLSYQSCSSSTLSHLDTPYLISPFCKYKALWIPNTGTRVLRIHISSKGLFRLSTFSCVFYKCFFNHRPHPHPPPLRSLLLSSVPHRSCYQSESDLKRHINITDSIATKKNCSYTTMPQTFYTQRHTWSYILIL